MLGVLLCAVGVASLCALMSRIHFLSIGTTALVTPAHSSGHDERQSNDANDDHDYDDSCPHC